MERWALITHPQHLALAEKGAIVPPMAILERDLPWALGQEWIVIGRDSDIPYTPPIEQNLQSNPHRVKHGYGYTEDDRA